MARRFRFFTSASLILTGLAALPARGQFMFETLGGGKPELSAPPGPPAVGAPADLSNDSLSSASSAPPRPQVALRSGAPGNSADKPLCLRLPTAPENNGSVGDAHATASAAELALGPAADLTGECPNSYHDLAEDLAISMKNKVAVRGQHGVPKAGGEAATADDWIAVDLIARTLFAEIGGDAKCTYGDEYLKALGRVIMNRRDYMHSPSRRSHTNFFKKNSKVKNELALAAIRPNEFQVWLPDNIARNLWMVCPATKIQTVHRDETGKAFESSSMRGFLTWGQVVQVASEMVFDEKKFRCETPNVKSIFYTQSRTTPGKDFVLRLHDKVGKLTINNPECMQLWENPKEPIELPADDCPKPRR